MGVKTIASCCGHKRVEGFIAVKEDSIEIMKQLGYTIYINPLYPESKQWFKPKTK